MLEISLLNYNEVKTSVDPYGKASTFLIIKSAQMKYLRNIGILIDKINGQRYLSWIYIPYEIFTKLTLGAFIKKDGET